MADTAEGTQFSDLPSRLAIEILVRLPVKALLICRYVRKDWTRLYFSNPNFVRRQLETSNIQFLDRHPTRGGKIRFGCFVDEISTGKVRMENFELSCKLLHDPNRFWSVVNSCNGLLCVIALIDNSSVFVCNPILGEWVSIQVPDRTIFSNYSSVCALGFSAKNNQYKILLCNEIRETNKPTEYEWKIYTLGTGLWRSIETKETIKPWDSVGLDFNTFINGSLHYARDLDGGFVLQSFDFETERFTVLPLPKLQSDSIKNINVTFGVINCCLWASSYDAEKETDGEMWAMKEYGVDKSWTMMLALRNYDLDGFDDTTDDEELLARNKELVIYEDHRIGDHHLLFTLNGVEVLISHYSSSSTSFICYNIKTMRRRRVVRGRRTNCPLGYGTAYNPSFVSLHDVGKGEQVIR